MFDRRAVVGTVGLAALGGICSGVKRLDAAMGTGQAINVDDHGASTKNGPDANLRAFQAAIAATPPGGRMIIPSHGDESYLVDTTGGLDHALAIDHPITIVLLGRVKATDGVSRRNPPYIFKVSAPDVAFTGTGVLSGSGFADDRNVHEDQTHAGLVFVTGDRFRFEGITVSDVPKIGIHLWNCRDAMISARWRGGIRDYVIGHTALFGIRATGKGGHRIVSNRFERDEQGRRLITGYFAGGSLGSTSGDEIYDNFADVHEKIAYLFTNNSKVSHCRAVDAMRTDVVRIVGSGNIVEYIFGKRVMGGVSVYDGHDNIIRKCYFEDVYQSGIYISSKDGYGEGFSRTSVTGNTIIAAADATELQDGICLYMGNGDTSSIVISGNNIDSRGGASWQNGIRVVAIPPLFADRPTVRNNNISGAVNGLYMRRLNGAVIDRNRVDRLRGGEALLSVGS